MAVSPRNLAVSAQVRLERIESMMESCLAEIQSLREVLRPPAERHNVLESRHSFGNVSTESESINIPSDVLIPSPASARIKREGASCPALDDH